MSKARVTENQVKNLLFYLENHSKKDFSKIGKSYEEMRKDLSGEVHAYLQGILKEIAEFETELQKKWEEKQAG